MPLTAALTLVALHATAAVVVFGPVAPMSAALPAGARATPAIAASPEPSMRSFLPIRYIETSEPTVAITFDACATRSHQYTFDRGVFEVVKREGIPVTIFVGGRWVEAHPDVMAELASDPLVEFGDHSYDHPHMSHLPVARMVEQIDQTE